MQCSQRRHNNVARKTRRCFRWVYGPPSLRKEKQLAHRADRRNAKQALKSGQYERYERHQRPRLTERDVS